MPEINNAKLSHYQVMVPEPQRKYLFIRCLFPKGSILILLKVLSFALNSGSNCYFFIVSDAYSIPGAYNSNNQKSKYWYIW